jgi:DNA invertase Pin-like site-specific DNA recombinase
MSATAQEITISKLENEQVTIKGSGFKKNGNDRTYQVNIYINSDFEKQILTQGNGSFSYTSKKGAIEYGDRIKVQVNQWHSSSKHFIQTFDIIKIGEPIGEQIVKISEYSRGQVTLRGSGFLRTGLDRQYEVNIYIENKFIKQIFTNGNGSFSYTTPKDKLKRGHKITVQVNQWYSEQEHWKKTFKIPRGKPIYPRVVSMGKFESDQITFTGKGFVREDEELTYQVLIFRNSRQLGKIRTNPNGSFSYTTRRGSVETNDDIKVVVKNWHTDQTDWVKKFTIPESEEVKRARAELARKLPGYAIQQANTLINRIAPDYAEIISWKRSFALSFIRQFERSSDRYSDGKKAFSDGLKTGQASGQTKGRNAGKQQASRVATNLAEIRVTKAYRNAVDDPSRRSLQELTNNLPAKSFQGDKQPAMPGDLSAVTYQLNRSLNGESKGLDLNYISRSELGQLNLERVRDYQSASSLSMDMISAQDAFSAWKNGRFGGRYDYNLYNHPLITNELREQFKRVFREHFQSSIHSKVEKRTNNSHYSASNIGRKYGQLLGEEKVQEEGRVDGYNKTFGPAAEQAFEQTFGNTFRNTFRTTVDKYENNAVLVETSSNIIEENDNLLWERGEKIGLNIRSLVNMGRRPANLKVFIESGSAVSSINQGELSLEGLSSVKASQQVFPELAQIKSNLADEKEYSARVKIGKHYTRNQTFYIGWKKVIKNLKAAIFDANNDGVWEKGENIGVKIIGGQNISRADAQFDLRLSGRSVKILRNGEKFTLKGSASIIRPMVYKDLVRIPNNISENQEHQLKLTIGSFSYTFNFVVGWDNIIHVYADRPNAKIKAQIISNIKQEWTEITARRQRKNWYKHGRDGKLTYLASLVQKAQSLGVQKYKTLADPSVCQMIGKRYWISSPRKYNFAKSFKKLWKVIDPQCK